MNFTAKQIAGYLKGEIVGNESVKVNNVAKIEEGKPGCISFLANPKYTQYLYSTESSIVLVNNDLDLEGEVKATMIKVDDAYKCFASLLDMYVAAKDQPKGIDKKTKIEKSAKVGKKPYIGTFTYIGHKSRVGDNAKIYPQVYIGNNVTIGDNVTLYPGVKIYEDCVLGNNVTIHAGSIIGSDGFGFAPSNANDYKKIPQIGNVILEDDVEIGANATIDRATMGSTIIRKGVKLDNLNHMAHNVEIGAHTVMAAQCGIAGSTKIGENCMFGGQVGIAPHTSIADGTKVGAQSGIATKIRKKDQVLLGSPAIDIRNAQKSIFLFKNLPDMNQKIKDLEKQLKELKELVDNK